MTNEEQETVITTHQNAKYVEIWTAQRRFITKLRKESKAQEVASGLWDGSEWVRFRIEAADWNPVTGIKRARNLTDAQRKALSDRLKAHR